MYKVTDSEINKEMFSIIYELAGVRTYNASGVFKGIMIRDKEKAHELVRKARGFIERVEIGEYEETIK